MLPQVLHAMDPVIPLLKRHDRRIAVSPVSKSLSFYYASFGERQGVKVIRVTLAQSYDSYLFRLFFRDPNDSEKALPVNPNQLLSGGSHE